MVRVLISPCKRNWHSGGKIAMLVLEQMDGGTFAIAHTLGGATSRGIPFAAARVGVRFPQSTDGGWKSARSGRFSRHLRRARNLDRKSTRLNSSHGYISYAVFCLKKKKNK